MGREMRIAKWELFVSWTFFVLVGALLNVLVPSTPAHAGVGDDASAVRAAVEHIDRLLTHKAQVDGWYVP